MLERILLGAIPGLPLSAALIIGIATLCGWAQDETQEPLIAKITIAVQTSAFCGTVLVALAYFNGWISGKQTLVNWLASGEYRADIGFLIDGLSSTMMLLVSAICLMVSKFSSHYMHREPGFFRFFFILNLFASAILLLVMADNAMVCFLGWELAGLCSYLLIAYFYDRPIPAGNATRVFITNRIGDAGFVLGIALAILWLGSSEWNVLFRPETNARLGVLAFCFITAACAKSAQFPFTPWLARAMEGPTPSSALFYGAVMVHAGVYLILRLQPLIEQSPLAMSVLILLGSVTALYGYISGLVQTDIKSALIFSTSAQVGLMFVSCGLGFWSLALIHLIAHAIVRSYQFLTAPSILKQLEDVRIRRVSPMLANMPLVYTAALQRFWVDELTDNTLSKPVQRAAAELDRIDTDVVDQIAHLPATTTKALAALANWGETKLDSSLEDYARDTHGARLPTYINLVTQNIAEALDRFEQGVILQLAGLLQLGGHLAKLFVRTEVYLAEPRKVAMVLFVLLILIATGAPL